MCLTTLDDRRTFRPGHSVSNTLWKWCAEYTQRNPWVFVFFLGSMTTWLLPENMDRCVREIGGATTQAQDDATDSIVPQPVSYARPPPRLSLPTHPSWCHSTRGCSPHEPQRHDVSDHV